jgi:hypothetical protein
MIKFTKLTIKINSTDKPFYFIGSQIRGAFGYALRNIVKDKDLMTTYTINFLNKRMLFILIDLIYD